MISTHERFPQHVPNSQFSRAGDERATSLLFLEQVFEHLSGDKHSEHEADLAVVTR